MSCSVDDKNSKNVVKFRLRDKFETPEKTDKLTRSQRVKLEELMRAFGIEV